MPTTRQVFQETEASEHGRSAVAHVSADAGVSWATMPILPDCERVPSAGVAVGSPDAGGETMPIPSDCERVPGLTLPPVPAMLVRRRCRSREIAHTSQPPALPPMPLALTGKRYQSCQAENACLVPAVTLVTLFVSGPGRVTIRLHSLF